MSENVISLSRHKRPIHAGSGALFQTFATQRRDQNDVFWLKENAEILNIFECASIEMRPEDLACYQQFYDDLPKRMAFFPQYYRFFTSMACDLEALGVKGEHATQLCERVYENGFASGELSDLQRAEAQRLLARRGFQLHGSAQLSERLHHFIDQSANFAVPNRKAAYELTHIVFYLSEYGRLDPKLSAQAVQSLMFTGILAHLEQNLDLLAEVCLALRYAAHVPPVDWENYVVNAVDNFAFSSSGDIANDTYHEYLVANWAVSQMRRDAFLADHFNGALTFHSQIRSIGSLGAISEVLYDWNGPRSKDWNVMSSKLNALLPFESASHLDQVVSATSEFGAFFEHFVRADIFPASPKVVEFAPKFDLVT